MELKRTDWRRAAQQALAYQEWANTSWLVLGQRPSIAAIKCLSISGIGLAYLGEDKRLHCVLRPTSRRRPAGLSGVWAGEQALVHALGRGSDPLAALRPGRATSQAALASIAR